MGHDEEFTDWAGRCTPALLRRAHLLCGDRQLAEDLVQETLVKMFLHWRRVDADGNPLGFALTTLFRVFCSGRRRRSASELPSETLLDRPAPVGSDPGLRLDLVAALQALTPKQRCVVVARYVDDRPIAEVAALMHRTEGWVRVTAHRALLALRDSPLMAMSDS